LAEALRLAGVGIGDTVALPAFICRDVLAAVHARGAVARFYPVGADLNLAGPATSLPPCAAVIAVNYFGFPQELTPFQDYCRRTGAVLIEDNAHGLFSRDSSGRFLGTRGALGIFSLRKTLPLPNGAALILNGGDFSLGPPQPFDSGFLPLRYHLKRFVRHTAPFVGARTLHRLLRLIRWWKQRVSSGSATKGNEDEQSLPEPAHPCASLSRPLTTDIGQEAARRRALYLWVAGRLRDAELSVTPVFASLPDTVVPYGYPFYADPVTFPKVAAVLSDFGLSCLSWPDQLPSSVDVKALPHYHQLRFVTFLW
jgi:hypothetical protein